METSTDGTGKNILILTPIPKLVNSPNLKQSFKFWKEMYEYSKKFGHKLIYVFAIQQGSNALSVIAKLKVPKKYIIYPYEYIESRFVDIAIARNILLSYAIENNPDYILFLDSDVAPPKDSIEKFILHNKDICGGIVRTFNGNGEIIFNFGQWNGNKPNSFEFSKEIPADKLSEVGFVDTACVFLSRNIYKNYKFATCFDNGVDETHEFFYRVNKIHKIYLDSTIQCWHFRGEIILGVTPPPGYIKKIRNGIETYFIQ